MFFAILNSLLQLQKLNLNFCNWESLNFSFLFLVAECSGTINPNSGEVVSAVEKKSSIWSQENLIFYGGIAVGVIITGLVIWYVISKGGCPDSGDNGNSSSSNTSEIIEKVKELATENSTELAAAEPSIVGKFILDSLKSTPSIPAKENFYFDNKLAVNPSEGLSKLYEQHGAVVQLGRKVQKFMGDCSTIQTPDGVGGEFTFFNLQKLLDQAWHINSNIENLCIYAIKVNPRVDIIQSVKNYVSMHNSQFFQLKTHIIASDSWKLITLNLPDNNTVIFASVPESLVINNAETLLAMQDYIAIALTSI